MRIYCQINAVADVKGVTNTPGWFTIHKKYWHSVVIPARIAGAGDYDGTMLCDWAQQPNAPLFCGATRETASLIH